MKIEFNEKTYTGFEFLIKVLKDIVIAVIVGYITIRLTAFVGREL